MIVMAIAFGYNPLDTFSFMDITIVFLQVRVSMSIIFQDINNGKRKFIYR